jgi:hypothetical protein
MLEEDSFYYVKKLSNKNIKIHTKKYSNVHTKQFLWTFLDAKSLIIVSTSISSIISFSTSIGSGGIVKALFFKQLKKSRFNMG